MINISQRVGSISPSQTIQIDTQAKALLAAGKSVINLSVGELDFETPDNVLTAAHQAVNAKLNHYTPTQGLPETRQAICSYLLDQHQLNYEIDNIIVTNGGKQAIFVAIQVLVNPGDEVLVPIPAWVSYSEQIRFAGGMPVNVKTTDLFELDFEALEKACTSHTKGIIINYPNNPTGAVYTEQDLQTLADFCAEHDLWVISDEIYECLVYPGSVSFRSFAQYATDRTVVINGVSKSGAMTGWRCGYAAGPAHIIKAMNALQSHLTGNVANVVQLTAQEALQTSRQNAQYFLTQLEPRRQLVMHWVGTQPNLRLVPPAGAFYCFIDIRLIANDSEEFCERLLHDHYVALVPGKFFSQEGFVRLSFANSFNRVETALQRLADYIATY